MAAVTVVWLWAGRLTWALRLPRPRPAAPVLIKSKASRRSATSLKHQQGLYAYRRHGTFWELPFRLRFRVFMCRRIRRRRSIGLCESAL